MTRLPRNGEALLRLRRRGLRPAGRVRVSLIGALGGDAFTLYADPGARCDFRLLAGLDVELMANVQAPFAAVLRTLADLAACAPSTLSLAYGEGPRVDCGRAECILTSWQPRVGRMMFNWFPLSADGGLDSMRLARRLRAALGGALPTPFDAALAHLAALLEQAPHACA